MTSTKSDDVSGEDEVRRTERGRKTQRLEENQWHVDRHVCLQSVAVLKLQNIQTSRDMGLYFQKAGNSKPVMQIYV